MLSITCIAHIPGPVGLPVFFGYHTFQAAADGQLEHWIDGTLSATVPPEGWDGYAQFWPQCADLVSQLKRAQAAKLPEDVIAGAIASVAAAVRS